MWMMPEAEPYLAAWPAMSVTFLSMRGTHSALLLVEPANKEVTAESAGLGLRPWGLGPEHPPGQEDAIFGGICYVLADYAQKS